MTMTDRDKKIALVLVPILLLGAYWFFALSPKRTEAQRLGTQLEQVEQTRDDAVSRAAVLEGSRRSYANDYATVVRLGKAIPSTVDMPSLLVQLDEAAKGTKIRFGKVTAGARAAATNPAPPAPTSGATSPAPAPAGNAAAGGAPAQTAPGQAAEAAGNTAATSNQTSAAPSGTSAPTPTAAAGAVGTPGTTTAAPGLDSLPLTFEFSGDFFDMADFLHEMKRFVYVANKRVRVDGRLMTIDGFKFDSIEFPTIKAEVQATVYLSPKAQGATAGASPTGPAPATPVPAGQTAPEPAPPTSPGAAAAPQSVGVQ